MKTAINSSEPHRTPPPNEAAKQSRDRIALVIRTVKERWEKRDFDPTPPNRQTESERRARR